MDKVGLAMKFRRLYSVLHGGKLAVPPAPPREMDKEEIQRIVHAAIMGGGPLMVARFGSIECDVCENVKYTFYKKRSNWKFVRWKGQPNFINPYLVKLFGKNAGFFPADDVEAWKRFYLLMIECMPQVDILNSWCHNELDFSDELKNAVKVDRERMTPLLTDNPWTRALKGRKVLVVHPFAETIKSQYARREQIFPENQDILPEFDLRVLKAVQTAGGGVSDFKTWFEALDYMKHEMDACDYDICLIGCGAYGFPLAAHAKQMGKQAIHLGGVLQLLFGIKGRRWETEETYLKDFRYIDYYNDAWVRPSALETPVNSMGVEGNCYW